MSVTNCIPGKVKLSCRGDADLTKISLANVLRRGDDHFVVYLRRIVFRPSNKLPALSTIDEHLERLTHFGLVKFQADALLEIHDGFHSLLLHGGRHIVWQGIGVSILFV